MYGKKIGDSLTIQLSSEDAFGECDESLTFTDGIKNVPLEFRKIGAEIEATNDRGETRNFYVTRFDDKTLTVNGTHPRAGQRAQSLSRSRLSATPRPASFAAACLLTATPGSRNWAALL
ncbi:MAG: hypothetical protein DSZ33_06540 [Gammaproteobacteria bacterium]|nr:MAG: hypothetical protein DSZ33_06540 [Gammaproteobacteria bacterium]